ncbi:antitoxin Xre/MbcA/ParS toxin-binding domain-containing protein [Spirosoma sp. KNUC1025]|uniref:antitoxin Xre/MbcA/ParS toxin-binding domain-containing protein n=1 Tax=Spirosoma sp. KNUC1025 TaxID=2894082 RepID=UPI001E2E9D84|nr:MbcA/ParS/Xre antitoxin family protein [Spirosoma sp. KNUC1025]UFH57812.1 MbcA/ParS/Xre antitoxin family protein [Spirosoma sp. KNUC1025]
MKRAPSPQNLLLRDVPGHINDSEILSLLYTREVNWQHVNAIKTLTEFNDAVILDWLNVSVKTFREYKKPPTTFKENVKEQVLLLLALIKHGIQVFGSVKEFDQWLNRSNFYFDNKSPNAYLNTITGIKFVDDRLTALDYGDNV